MTDDITTDGPEARAALVALTSVHYFQALTGALDRIEAARRVPVTGPTAELGLSDYDVSVGDALNQMLNDARGTYVTRPVIDYMPMDEYELAFELGTVEQLRQISRNAEAVRDYADRIADLLQEERFGSDNEGGK